MVGCVQIYLFGVCGSGVAGCRLHAGRQPVDVPVQSGIGPPAPTRHVDEPLVVRVPRERLLREYADRRPDERLVRRGRSRS